MERLINTTIAVLGMYVWVFRKYGIVSMFTKKVAKHAAIGYASRKHSLHWLGAGHRMEGIATPASQVIARLRAERMPASYGLAA